MFAASKGFDTNELGCGMRPVNLGAASAVLLEEPAPLGASIAGDRLGSDRGPPGHSSALSDWKSRFCDGEPPSPGGSPRVEAVLIDMVRPGTVAGT
jgi:hypothetical protein